MRTRNPARNKRGRVPTIDATRILTPTVAILLLMLLLGGSSSRASASFLLLSILSIPVLGWALFRPQRDAVQLHPFLLWWSLAGAALLLLHLLPLPAGLWGGLPGRDALGPGIDLSGVDAKWRPLSVDPQGTLSALLWLVAPAAMIAVALRDRDLQPVAVSLSIAGFSLFSLLFGFLQVSGPPDSLLYLHQETNWGLAVGLFANANHLGTLLVVAIPLVAALLVHVDLGGERRLLPAAALVGFALACAAGIYLTESIAALVLWPGALLLGLAIVLGIGGKWGRGIGLAVHPLAFAALVAGAYAAQDQPIVRSLGPQYQERAVIARSTVEAVEAYWPLGSGLGSFVPVYTSYEDPKRVSDRFTNHAHNDYLELLLEAGLPGVLLILSLVGWWGMRSLRVWDRFDPERPWPRAASAAVGLILCHSVVDYPIRTPAIAAIFALQILMLGETSPSRRSKIGEEVRPSRHLTLDSDELQFR